MRNRFLQSNTSRKAAVLILLTALFAQSLNAQSRTDENEKNRRLGELVEAMKRKIEEREAGQKQKPAEPAPSPARRNNGGRKKKTDVANRNAGDRAPAPKPSPAATEPAPTPSPAVTEPPRVEATPPNADALIPAANLPVPAASLSAGKAEGEGYTLKPVELNVGQWPLARLDFSIERGDRAPFTSLTAANIQASLDGQPAPIAPNDLIFKSSASSGVLFVIDLSGSMAGDRGGVSKLEATKAALLSLVDSLNAMDRVGLIVFDLSQRVVVEPTADRQALKTAIGNLRVQSNGGGTALYSAADYALRFAETNGLGNIILLSDGCEDSPESRRLGRTGLAQFKSGREQQIAGASHRSGIRIFTIAIGEQNPGSPLYVDAASLANLTRGTKGGFSSFIDLPALLQQAAGDGDRYSSLLIESLKSALDRIRESFRYDYSLLLRNIAVPTPDGQPHKVTILFRVGDAQLPLEFSYTWGAGMTRPTLGELEVPPPILIDTPAGGISRLHLGGIFASLLALLGLLALAPLGARVVERWKQRRRLGRSIVTLKPDSALIGEMCPNEGGNLGGSRRFKPGDIAVLCPGCGTAHHLGCWQLSQNRCWNRHCDHELPVSSGEAELTQVV